MKDIHSPNRSLDRDYEAVLEAGIWLKSETTFVSPISSGPINVLPSGVQI